MAITVAIDAFQCIPFAYLRYKKRPIKFAALKLLNIFMAIVLNIVFFLILPISTRQTAAPGSYPPSTTLRWEQAMRSMLISSVLPSHVLLLAGTRSTEIFVQQSAPAPHVQL